jgi:hypothetical protein
MPRHLLRTSKIFEKDKIGYFKSGDIKNPKKIGNKLRKFFSASFEKIEAIESDILQYIKKRGYYTPKPPQTSFLKTRRRRRRTSRRTRRR